LMKPFFVRKERWRSAQVRYCSASSTNRWFSIRLVAAGSFPSLTACLRSSSKAADASYDVCPVFL